MLCDKLYQEYVDLGGEWHLFFSIPAVLIRLHMPDIKQPSV